jgi:hypothetical protein
MNNAANGQHPARAGAHLLLSNTPPQHAASGKRSRIIADTESVGHGAVYDDLLP